MILPNLPRDLPLCFYCACVCSEDYCTRVHPSKNQEEPSLSGSKANTYYNILHVCFPDCANHMRTYRERERERGGGREGGRGECVRACVCVCVCV